MAKHRILMGIFGLALLGTALSLSLPQDKQKDSAYEISVSAVSIAVTVQDKKGRFINDLTEKDFSVFENQKKQHITYFRHDFQTPISLTVLLDVSGSMELQDKMKECKEALSYLVTYLLRPQDEVSLLIFADGEVEVASRFSTDKQDFLTVLEGAEAYGQTALNDAVAVSPEFANRGKNEKRALLLITDGVENDSYSTPEQAVEIARRVDVPIYTIGYKIPLSEQLERHKRTPGLSSAGIVETLGRFSRATGGTAHFLDRAFDLNAAMRDIKRELSHQYIIGYTAYTDPDGSYRKIEVRTSKKKYRVRTREGY
jgi:VWFA-related protein